MTTGVINKRKGRWLAQFKKYLPFYLFLLIPIAQVIIFNYLPMYGIQIAFKDYKLRRGITGSEWIGFKHFRKMLNANGK